MAENKEEIELEEDEILRISVRRTDSGELEMFIDSDEDDLDAIVISGLFIEAIEEEYPDCAEADN